MARRKRQFLEDDDSDSSPDSDGGNVENIDDPDLREERALFENPYKRKRQKKNAKEDAIYGVFGDDSEDEEPRGRGTGSAKRSDWTKAPAFVSSGKKVGVEEGLDAQKNAPKVEAEADMGEDDQEGQEDEGEDEDGDEDQEDEYMEDVSDEELPRPLSPKVREVEEDPPEQLQAPQPRIGGIGFKARSNTQPSFTPTFVKHDADSGASPSKAASSSPRPSSTASGDPLPASFGNARLQRSFVREKFTPSTTPVPLSAAEKVHFSKLQGSFGARMLQKMGWQAGTGLGTSGEGIVTPVETKLRPQKMGIAFRGFKEKTEQAKAEARRRGEIVSDDEEAPSGKGRKGAKSQAHDKRSDAWKKPKKVKTRIEHKTYEQIVAEAGEEASNSGLGQIIDATGAVPREVQSLAEVSLSSWTPSTDPTRMPEVRHNLRLISEACKTDLDGLAREAKALEERKKWITNEDARLRKKVEEEAELISRLQRIHLVADDISTQSKQLASVYEANLEPFEPYFYKLIGDHSQEFDHYRLDEIVVAAIAPLVRRMVAEWQPLRDPTAFLSTFRHWRAAFRINNVKETTETQMDVYGSGALTRPPSQLETPMTPFESLLWNVWLPKVRSSLNNDWSPSDPQPAVSLYEAWSSFLPPFIRDNLLDQLILPKVHKAVADWNPRKDEVSLQTIVFPWLQHVGLRLEGLVDDARRKVKILLRGWETAQGVPDNLIAWREVFGAGDWDAMLLKYVVPKLGATLRNDFRINPRKQDMQSFMQVLAWNALVRPTVFSQLFEMEFFPKWLDVLHVWLIQPHVSLEEVSEWYRGWKNTFPKNVQVMPGVAHGFNQGLQLMNKALELGPDAAALLPRPEYKPHASSRATTPQKTKALPKPKAARTEEITFRSIVEEHAAAHNLLFIPTGQAHDLSRMPLFRVSKTVDGRGGLLVYILDDAVWAPDPESGQYRAISLEDMIIRANH